MGRLPMGSKGDFMTICRTAAQIIGAILVRRGMSNMSPSELAPDRTAAQLRQDMQVAKEQMR